MSRFLAEQQALHERAWSIGYKLFPRVLKSKKATIGAEVGVAFGGHAEAILIYSDVRKLYGVDPYQHIEGYKDPMNLPQAQFDALHQQTKKRLSSFADRFQLIRARSPDAAGIIREALDFVYLDADHTYEGVRADLCAWYPKVREGGVIGGHDYGHPDLPGVKQAVDEFFGRFRWRVQLEGEGVWWVEKQALNTSFIMPAYNCANTVRESVASILEGNLDEGDRLIIIDDGSTDETGLILDDLRRRSHIIELVKHRENKGGGAARNAAVESADSEILFCLDSDNVLVPGSAQRLKAFLVNCGGDVAAFRELHYFVDDKAHVTHKWVFMQGPITLADFLAGHVTPPASGNYMFTRESWSRAGGYPEFAGALDAWGFGLRQLATGARMTTLPNSFYYHRYGHDSYWVTQSRGRNVSLTALQVVLPFLDLLCEKDVDYIMGRKGRYTWFENLQRHPIRLRSGDTGVTGFKAEMKPENHRTQEPLSRLVTRGIKRAIGFAARRPRPWRS